MWKSWKSSLKLEQKSVAINSISILPAGSELELPIDLEAAKESSRAALPWTLTQAPAAVEDLEAALHAGCQEHEITRGVPLQPPNPTFHVGVSQRLLHVPGVPQQHVLVVAGDTPQTGRKAAQLSQGTEERQERPRALHHMEFLQRQQHVQVTEEVGHTRGEQLEGTHLPVARRFSRWGLH